MKKILVLMLSLVLSFTFVVSGFATYTTFEDEDSVSAKGLSVNNREDPATGSGAIYKFRNEFTNSHNNDTARTTNKIVDDGTGNLCVKLDASEAWQTDNGLFQNGATFSGSSYAYLAVDIKPTTIAGFAGLFFYQNGHDKDACALANATEEFLNTGVGMTLAKDGKSVIIYANLEKTISYKCDTGLDLTTDWHTYKAFITKDKFIAFMIDDTVIGYFDIENLEIWDADFNVIAKGNSGLYTDDPRCGWAFTNNDGNIDMLIDNLDFQSSPRDDNSNYINGCLDNIVLVKENESRIKNFDAGEGKAFPKFTKYRNVVNAYADEKFKEIIYAGWIGFTEEIDSFGYQINDETPVFDSSFKVDAEEAVKDAEMGGGTNGARYEVTVPVSALKGKNIIKVVAKVGDEVIALDFATSHGYALGSAPNTTTIYYGTPEISIGATVTSDITINAYVNGAFDESKYTIKFYDGENEIDSITESTEYGTAYNCTGIVMSAANKEITVKLYRGDDLVTEKTFSVMDYLKKLQSDENVSVKDKQLAANVAKLCSEMNKYKGGEGFETVGTPTDGAEIENVDSMTVTGDAFTGAALFVDNSISIKFFFDKTVDADKLLINGVEIEAADISSGVIETENISFANLTKQYTVKLMKGETEVASVTYSAANYINNKLTSEKVGGVANAMAALYNML